MTIFSGIKNLVCEKSFWWEEEKNKTLRVLENKIPNAENFRYKEFIKSETAIRHNIANIPNEQEWQNIELLTSRVLQPIRNVFGPIRILSGYRSKKVNTLINGSTTSNHCRGEAADIEPIDAKITFLEIIDWVTSNLEFRNLILEYPPYGWIHIDYRKGGNIRRIKLKDKKHDYKLVTLDYLHNYIK